MVTPNRKITTHQLERTPVAQSDYEKKMADPFTDDEPIAATCDTENPAPCESCQ